MYTCPFSYQSTNSMPSLKVPCVWRRNSSSSMRTSLLNSWIAGIVASPTPTMPISEDSTSVMVSRGPSTRARAAAAIQPAAPPPAMTTDLTSWSATLEFVGQRQRVHRAVLLILDQVELRIADIGQLEGLVGEVGPSHAHTQPSHESFLELVADLRIQQRLGAHVLELQGRVELGHLADERAAIAVADSCRETCLLEVKGRVDHFLGQARHGRLLAVDVDRGIVHRTADDEAEAVERVGEDRKRHRERELGAPDVTAAAVDLGGHDADTIRIRFLEAGGGIVERVLAGQPHAFEAREDRAV